MGMFSNAVLGDVVSRSVSSVFGKCNKQQATSRREAEDLHRLHSLLLRSSTIIEEAQRRHVASRAMHQQLKLLRDETLRGYYILDTVRCPALLAEGDDDRGKDDGEAEEGSRRAFTLSRFNLAKRVRFTSAAAAGPQPTAVFGAAAAKELRDTVGSLADIIGDMKEFSVFLMSCPPMYRQPYSAHLFVDKCMFGRHMERERILEFLLLQDEPSGAAGNMGVLPIVGPMHIGKTTLVEHVCKDERVHNRFSMILFYSGNGLKDETMASFRDKCVIKHRNDSDLEKRLLIVIELLDDVDEETWKRLYSSERSMAQGSKMIITSRSGNIMRLGTTEALRLKSLTVEAFWYLFKMLVFGSDDPGQYPKMASLAIEMATVTQGSFFSASIGAILLRANFSTQIWSRILSRLKQYVQRNVSLMGEFLDDINLKDHNRRCAWSLIEPRPNKYFMLDEIYQINPALEEAPELTMFDLLSGRATQLQGKHDVLYWKSPILPYFNYVCKCEIVDIS